MEIRKVINQDEKTRITLEIMNALPEWFSPPEDIVNKSQIHREYPFFAAYDGDRAIGFVALKIHNSYTVDIYNLGVLREYRPWMSQPYMSHIMEHRLFIGKRDFIRWRCLRHFGMKKIRVCLW